MTPSEITDALEAQYKYDKAHYPPANPLFAQAAATIRELELQRDNFAALYAAAAKDHGTENAKLKIATEALECTRERIMTHPIDDHEHCMCGSRVEGHDIGSGHSPVSVADHAVSSIVEAIKEALARIKEAA